MAREDRFISFIIAHTSKSRARVQRIRVEKKSVTVFVTASIVLGLCLVYGLYGLTQQVRHLRTGNGEPEPARGKRTPASGT